MSINLKDLNVFAEKLAKASSWQISKTAFGGMTRNSSKNYLYEFYCYLRLANDLQNNYQLVYQTGNGRKKNKFPKSPAPKVDRPYFLLKENGIAKYQYCAGTQIKVIKGNRTKAPDISFQKHDADPILPSSSQVVLIYDAKYNPKNERFQEGQLDQFIVAINSLGLQNASKNIIKFKEFKDFSGHCVITNSLAPVLDVDYLGIHSVTEVENFSPNKTFNVINP